MNANTRVLLTDDSGTIRTILKGLLREMNVTDVVEACNGKEALVNLDKQRFDIMFLDVHMPKMDGLCCLEQIKQKTALIGLPVVIISSDTDHRIIERAKTLGAFGYIKKPFKVEGLRSAIAAALVNGPVAALETPTATASAPFNAAKTIQPQSVQNTQPKPKESSISPLSWLMRLIKRT